MNHQAKNNILLSYFKKAFGRKTRKKKEQMALSKDGKTREN